MRARGFTLIELLVVISIISLLSSIVLASVNTAREKGRSSAIKQGALQMVTALELHHSTYGTYSGFVVEPTYFFDQKSDCKDGVADYNNAEFISDEGAKICESILANLPTDQPSGNVGDMQMVASGDWYMVRVKTVNGHLNHWSPIYFCADASGARRVGLQYSANSTCYP
jgi:prepilin-type N-terminal cleavage/methylation domain-containing protein